MVASVWVNRVEGYIKVLSLTGLKVLVCCLGCGGEEAFKIEVEVEVVCKL